MTAERVEAAARVMCDRYNPTGTWERMCGDPEDDQFLDGYRETARLALAAADALDTIEYAWLDDDGEITLLDSLDPIETADVKQRRGPWERAE